MVTIDYKNKNISYADYDDGMVVIMIIDIFSLICHYM